MSRTYITKIIKGDSRYSKERERQKQENGDKNKEQTRIMIYDKRELSMIAYECMKLQHFKDVGVLSHEVRIGCMP